MPAPCDRARMREAKQYRRHGQHGRRRSSGAASYYSDGLNDFSFANWENDDGLTKLIVEARPRDGGFTLESYALENNGSHLRVIMRIEPDNFNAPIELTRVYQRR